MSNPIDFTKLEKQIVLNLIDHAINLVNKFDNLRPKRKSPKSLALFNGMRQKVETSMELDERSKL